MKKKEESSNTQSHYQDKEYVTWISGRQQQQGHCIREAGSSGFAKELGGSEQWKNPRRNIEVLCSCRWLALPGMHTTDYAFEPKPPPHLPYQHPFHFHWLVYLLSFTPRQCALEIASAPDNIVSFEGFKGILLLKIKLQSITNNKCYCQAIEGIYFTFPVQCCCKY